MTSPEPLCCPKCGEQVAIVERVLGYLDWGLAVLDEEGVVRPEVHPEEMPAVLADNSTPKGVYAHCDNKACGYEWKLRRRFEPTLDAKEESRG